MKTLIKALGIVIIFSLFLGSLSATPQVNAGWEAQNNQPTETIEPGNPYFSRIEITLNDGTRLDRDIIGGPPIPPSGFDLQRNAATLPIPGQLVGTNSLTVPAYEWVFGCSAVSAAMIAGYQDNNGYPNMYSGPANGGVAPFDSSIWGTWMDGYGDVYPNNPLVASHQYIDGRATRGSLDDYWVKYESAAQDPYLTGGWTQHAWGESVGDFMKTSQSAYGNPDGSTSFYTWNSSSTPLTCDNMESSGISTLDGTYGRKLFYQARGYTVTDCYNQKTDNNGGGFTFAMYKAEIDAGKPVLLNLAGHSIVGIGYDDATHTIFIHDTWDTLNHSMTWGGSYTGMALLSVSIVHLANPTQPPGSFSKSTPPNGETMQPASLTLHWGTSSGADSYEYCIDKINNNTCDNGWTNGGTATSVQLSDLESGATFYWQVRARNTIATTESNDNGWWHFSEAYRPPTITEFSPLTGSEGTDVSITGTNFNGATTVSFNGTNANFNVVSPTLISATAPQGATSGKITVATPGGIATSSLDFTVLASVFIQFSAQGYTQTESSGTVSIPVTLSSPPSQTVTVNYTTGDGSAIAGEDYISSSGTLTFAVGVTTQSINVGIIDDFLDEPDSETVILTLSSPVNASITGTNPAALFIMDNDAPPEVHFGASQAWVSESNGTASLNVTLNGVSGKTVSIGYTSSDDTAIAGSDYMSVQGILTFNPGQVSQSITVPINDDWLHEPVEIFTIILSDPKNSNLGSPTSSNIMIVDDDPLRLFIPIIAN